jgi:D-lactate dehydrogenase (cytochrome)
MQSKIERFVSELQSAAPACRILLEEKALQLYSTDIFWRADTRPAAVALPLEQDHVIAALQAAHNCGLNIVPRGAGVSYTKGYLPAVPETVMLDTSKMNKVIEVREQDGYVRVEAGCTWADVAAAVEAVGYSTGYRGPFSGLVATVGGAVSQNSGGFGSARHGTVAECVLGLTVVLADGRLLKTGSAARIGARPFSRANGPDLTGLFIGDNGAFGVKTEIVLRVRRKPEHAGFASFGFADLQAITNAQCELARAESIVSSFGFDRLKGELATRSMRAKEGAETLLNLARSDQSLISGLATAARVAIGGLAFLIDHAYTLHVSVECDSAVSLKCDLEKIHKLCKSLGGRELPNSVPLALQAKPFNSLRGMLGLDGERWVPVHGLFPLSVAADVIVDWRKFKSRHADALASRGMRMSLLTMTVGYEFFFEPAFYWEDELYPIHTAVLGKAVTASWHGRCANSAATDYVGGLRGELQETFAALGGVSWQVGRDYPFREILEPDYFRTLMDIKSALDPRHAVNPGALGFD